MGRTDGEVNTERTTHRNGYRPQGARHGPVEDAREDGQVSARDAETAPGVADELHHLMPVMFQDRYAVTAPGTRSHTSPTSSERVSRPLRGDCPGTGQQAADGGAGQVSRSLRGECSRMGTSTVTGLASSFKTATRWPLAGLAHFTNSSTVVGFQDRYAVTAPGTAGTSGSTRGRRVSRPLRGDCPRDGYMPSFALSGEFQDRYAVTAPPRDKKTSVDRQVKGVSRPLRGDRPRDK